MKKNFVHAFSTGILIILWSFVLILSTSPLLKAQDSGTILGRVVEMKTGDGLISINVRVKGTNLGATSDAEGRYTIRNVPAGVYTVSFTAVGFSSADVENVEVKAGATSIANATLASVAIPISETLVYGASLRPERITEAPAAVSVVRPEEIQQQGGHGQLPRLLETVPGVDVVQSGVQDFNINARGFNSSLNRRLLVLQDGRDLSVVLLGAQEWNGLSMPLEDLGRIEIVRGPGSALYGANAYNGVISITTPAPKDVLGTKISLVGGQLDTYRGDVRHAGLSGDWSYRINAGGIRTNTWTVSRTAPEAKQGTIRTTGGTTLATFDYPSLPVEARRYTADRLSSVYGSFRLDRDFESGSYLTLETGMTQVENEVVLTGIGRVHIPRARKPWGRVAYTSAGFFAQVWGSGRSAKGPHFSLQSGGKLITTSENAQVEFQHNFNMVENRLKVIWGASHRYQHEDTEQTLLASQRWDNSTGLFAQLEYKFADELKGVVAGRYDRGTLHDDQISPKVALVVTPVKDHSFRATFNKAFQVANYSEFFLRADAAAPSTGPQDLELGLESYFAAVRASLPSALVTPLNLPSNLPWEFKRPTRVLALGNKNLKVEKITGWELGYKGIIENTVFLTVDVFYNRLSDFVTDLLPGVNPRYPRFALTDGGVNVLKNLSDLEALYNQLNFPASHPLRVNLAALRAGYLGLNAQLGPLLANIENNERAGVLSYANAGKVDEKGFEVGGKVYVTDELTVDANWTYFDFEVKDQLVGDVLLPNTPKQKVNMGLSYSQRRGFNAGVTVKWVKGYPFAAGVFSGNVREYTIVNTVAGYHVTKNIHFGVNVFNLLNRKHYQIFGGSILERRILGTFTATL